MKRLNALVALVVLTLVGGLPKVAQAHFIWLAAGEDGNLHVYFSEAPEPDDPELLKYAQKASVFQIAPKGKPQQLPLEEGDESLVAKPKGKAGESVFVATHDFGVIERGGTPFLLRYYAKTGPQADRSAWNTQTGKHLALDLVPQAKGKKIKIQALWQGKPVQGAEYTVARPGKKDVKGQTDQAGTFTFTAGEPGLHAIRVKHVEYKSGEHQGKAYEEIRNYVTLALPVGSKKESRPRSVAKTKKAGKNSFADLPENVTSFGGAIAGGSLYTYGGHTGRAHSYSTEEQGNVLRRLKLDGQSQWETVAEGPHLQGLALVAHEGKVYRIGGFTAKNAKGEDHDLWSQDTMALFDPQSKTWKEMPSLPEPRSSFDAAVLNDAIYIVGGWALQGGRKTQWHKTAWKLDLSQENPEWEPLPEPPFQRRALSVAAYDGKIYAIGGMQKEGGPTTEVAVFNPKTQKWGEAGQLQGEPLTGFGSSAFATGGRLYVSTIKGNLQRLAKDGKSWEIVQETPTARFFHRMLPLGNNRLLMIGGANMQTGKFEELEVLNVK